MYSFTVGRRQKLDGPKVPNSVPGGPPQPYTVYTYYIDKTTWYVCWSRVGNKLVRVAALQELSLTPLGQAYKSQTSCFLIKGLSYLD